MAFISMAAFPFTYCVPGTCRRDVTFLSCWPPKNKIKNKQTKKDPKQPKQYVLWFFCLKAIEVLGSDQREFHVTGFTVLGIIVVFPLASTGARFHPALSKDCLRKIPVWMRWLILLMSNMTLSCGKVFASRHCRPFRSKARLTASQGRTGTRLKCWTQLSTHQHAAEGLSELLRILGFKYKKNKTPRPTSFGLLPEIGCSICLRSDTCCIRDDSTHWQRQVLCDLTDRAHL